MELLMESIQLMVLGMGTVFISLYILSKVTAILGYFFYYRQKKKENLQDTEKKSDLTEDKHDEDELVSVITSAIAASLQSSTGDIKILNITPTESRNRWKLEGRNYNRSSYM